MQSVRLEDMSAFESQAGNWQIVKDVTMDPSIDIHQKEEPAKKKKKKKSEPVPVAVSFEPGTGVLVNLPDDAKKDNLVTSWKHGDIELELEVMLPKGSNSGIYLQGRYEIQLLDSWGVADPKFSDIGGVYRNWETDPEKIYMGKAPLVNAAKAPGLWQKFRIVFQAPRFNEAGNKISNARLHVVELNGIVIHENVEIPKLTGGAIANEEASEGPLMIQGDHGPVAFRNIRYKLMKEPEMKLTDLTYKVYEGKVETVEAMFSGEPIATGSVDKLTYEVSDKENNFGIHFTGTLHIPEPGNYTFSSSIQGRSLLKVNNQKVLEGWGSSMGSIYLEKNAYPIELYYYKTESWVKRRLGLSIAGENTYELDLNTFGSAPPDGNVVSPIYVDAGSKPKLMRAFLDYEGDRSKRLTHAIGVGEEAIHYAYNMKAGNLICVWKGGFVDATPMWHNRGDGYFVPRGMVQFLSPGPAVAVLPEELTPFPDNISNDIYRSKGYKLDSDGRPSFSYTYHETEVTDKVYPGEGAAKFLREVTFSNVSDRTFFKIAEGSDIEELKQNTFIIGDKQYYITILSGAQPVVRKMGTSKELIVPVNNTPLIYSITW